MEKGYGEGKFSLKGLTGLLVRSWRMSFVVARSGMALVDEGKESLTHTLRWGQRPVASLFKTSPRAPCLTRRPGCLISD